MNCKVPILSSSLILLIIFSLYINNSLNLECISSVREKTQKSLEPRIMSGYIQLPRLGMEITLMDEPEACASAVQFTMILKLVRRNPQRMASAVTSYATQNLGTRFSWQVTSWWMWRHSCLFTVFYEILLSPNHKFTMVVLFVNVIPEIHLVNHPFLDSYIFFKNKGIKICMHFGRDEN